MKPEKQSVTSWVMHAALAVILLVAMNEILLGFIS